MLKTVKNMVTVDKRYKSLGRQQFLTAFLMAALAVGSTFTASLGHDIMIQERIALHNIYIENMRTARAERNFDGVNANYQEAIALDAGTYEPYYQLAMTFYDQRKNEQCLSYITENVYTNPEISMDVNYGVFYYLTANCYFELENHSAAVPYYRKALEIKPEELSYYRDYCIALARQGNTAEAEAVLQKAMEKGIASDALGL